MADTLFRECRTCGLEKPCRSGRRQCVDCEAQARKAWAERSGKHVPGRQRNYRQRREIAAVPVGESRPVSCTSCGIMRWFQKLPNGKGKGWRGLQCPDCSNEYARQHRAKQKEQGKGYGKCSKCGVEAEYANGNQCSDCVRSRNAAYQRQRRKEGKGGGVHLPAHSRICGKCRQRCRVGGVWRVADVCPPCWKKAESVRAKGKRAELKARMVSAGAWRCQQCEQTKPVDEKATGWAGQKCPPCQREYQRARYNEKLKHDPGYRRKKLARSREYEARRAQHRKAVQDAKSVPGVL